MASNSKIKNIKVQKKNHFQNHLCSPTIEEFKDLFEHIYGDYKIEKFNGGSYLESTSGRIFCSYHAALTKLKTFGARSEIILKDSAWWIRANGKWHLLCECLGCVEEDELNKANALLHPEQQLSLRLPFEPDYIVITDGKHAIMVPSINDKGSKD